MVRTRCHDLILWTAAQLRETLTTPEKQVRSEADRARPQGKKIAAGELVVTRGLWTAEEEVRAS